MCVSPTRFEWLEELKRFDGEAPGKMRVPALSDQIVVEFPGEAGYAEADIRALLASSVVQAQAGS